MRLWSIHPKYLDPQGLVALWRESLLAQKVLCGETRGYRNHPQLERFKRHAEPLAAISQYLTVIQAEAETRGYAFDKSKIRASGPVRQIVVSTGQIDYEWSHLMKKLSIRNPMFYQKWRMTTRPQTHPLFVVQPGEVELWERRQDNETD